MNLSDRIACLSALGPILRDTERVAALAQRAYLKNPWFIPAFVEQALASIATAYLAPGPLAAWAAAYDLEPPVPRRVGVVMAGNIPAVGFHDLLAVALSGHQLVAKLSREDTVLLPFVAEQLYALDDRWRDHLRFAEQLNGLDAYIATGTDNSARYFEHYFGKYPHIIRRNRTSVAVLSGQETPAELARLGQDVLLYFGLGCRNVSKVFVPQGYDFGAFYEAIQPLAAIYLNHHKYFNNYEYNKSVYLVNRTVHLDNGFLMLKPSPDLFSPISVLFYDEYAEIEELEEKIREHQSHLQCITSRNGWYPGSSPFGQAQNPSLTDYADGIDTLAFLTSL